MIQSLRPYVVCSGRRQSGIRFAVADYGTAEAVPLSKTASLLRAGSSGRQQGKAGALAFCQGALEFGCLVEVDVEDLDGVAGKGVGEGGCGVCDGADDWDDSGGVGDGVCVLCGFAAQGCDGCFGVNVGRSG